MKKRKKRKDSQMKKRKVLRNYKNTTMYRWKS